MKIMQPHFNAEILVMDEIGASKLTEWVWDTVAHILNSRYNNRRMTILTTNYLNLSPPHNRHVQKFAESEMPARFRTDPVRPCAPKR